MRAIIEKLLSLFSNLRVAIVGSYMRDGDRVPFNKVLLNEYFRMVDDEDDILYIKIHPFGYSVLEEYKANRYSCAKTMMTPLNATVIFADKRIM